jgi:hypothetical protein
MHICNWILQAVQDGVLDPKLKFFIDKPWFYLSEFINAQKNMYWNSTNPRHTFEVPLNDQNIQTWCVLTTTCVARYIPGVCISSFRFN